MKTTLLFFLAFSFFCFKNSQAQTEVKFNMVSGLIGVPNLGIETRISRKSSIQLDVLGSFWNSFLERPLQVIQIFSEYRYYPKGKFNNLYLGSHIGFGMFSITRLNEPQDIYHSGMSTFIGLSIGYKKKSIQILN